MKEQEKGLEKMKLLLTQVVDTAEKHNIPFFGMMGAFCEEHEGIHLGDTKCFAWYNGYAQMSQLLRGGCMTGLPELEPAMAMALFGIQYKENEDAGR